MKLAIEANRRQSGLLYRGHFVRFADSIAIPVIPKGQTIEFSSVEYTVIIVVQYRECLLPIAPKDPPRDRTKELQPGRDMALVARIPNQPSGL